MSNHDSSKEDAEMSENREFDKLKEDLQNVCDKIRINAALAPIRKEFEAIANGTKDIDPNLFKEFV
jgi:hypothetical protein